ncbi:MAG: hypothetical protein DHS20C01_34360 [marine bacterium B5-7]|nr:MAG: hypothetical protein DHS20C01_34360 [marine bacterium B5-7]
MITETKVFPNLYRDSVTLMQVSSALAGRDGIVQAQAVMASEGNLELLRAASLITEIEGFNSGDLIVVIEGDEQAVADALDDASSLLYRENQSRDGARKKIAPRSIEMAIAEHPTGNLALISTPGEYAAAEAKKALALGLNVMMFSDNVTIEDELELKQLANHRELMLMGPDCGTAIIDGTPLGFANAVRPGSIGVVAASGTGLQQVTCLIDRRGQGISQAIGTGGRDLKAAIGGMTMLRGLEALGNDSDTRVIVLVSKPPAPDVAKRLFDAAANIDKPVVINFLGAAALEQGSANIHTAATLDDAASIAVALAEGRDPSDVATTSGSNISSESEYLDTLTPEQLYIRGLFSGGTFCYESTLLLSATCDPVWSNTPLDKKFDIGDPWVSREHTLIDLGDDVFTRGRPHPMIDLSLRNERMVTEAADPTVAVLLLDIVLGYGAHDDPVAELVPAIQAAQQRAARDGRKIIFVASVCGTSLDPQGLERQESALRDVGVLLADSNAGAARIAARIAAHQQSRFETSNREISG